MVSTNVNGENKYIYGTGITLMVITLLLLMANTIINTSVRWILNIFFNGITTHVAADIFMVIAKGIAISIALNTADFVPWKKESGGINCDITYFELLLAKKRYFQEKTSFKNIKSLNWAILKGAAIMLAVGIFYVSVFPLINVFEWMGAAIEFIIRNTAIEVLIGIGLCVLMLITLIIRRHLKCRQKGK